MCESQILSLVFTVVLVVSVVSIVVQTVVVKKKHQKVLQGLSH